MDNIEKQIAIYTQNIANGVDLFESYHNRGKLFFNQKAYELALKDYNHAINIIDRLAGKDNLVHFIYYNRSYVYRKLKKYELALKDIIRFMELDDEFAEIYIIKAYLLDKLNRHELALNDYNKAIDIDGKSYLSYNNRGIHYHNRRKYQLAIKDFKKAITLKKEYANLYSNICISYKKIRNYSKMKFYGNLYLYYALKEQEIRIGSDFLNIWQDNIYNYTFLLENFTIDFDSFLYVNYRNWLQLIQPIEDYYSFLSLSNSNKRTQESQRAILNFYLGSPVAAFIHYDEILDKHYYPLTAQELYYYSLTTDILKFEEDEKILESALIELSNMEHKSAKALYYLGQLHLLNYDESNAIKYFQNSQEFIPSFIMLMSFEEDTAIQEQLLEKLLKLDQDILISYFTGYPKTAIKTEHSFETQFEHYFYTTELFTAVSKIQENYQLPEYLLGYNHLKIWEAFYLSDTEQAIIDKTFRNHKIQQLVDTITQDLEVKLVSIEDNDKTNYLEKIKHSLREDQDLTIREAFDSLLDTLKDDGNIENHLGQMIEDFRLEKAQLYLYFISYFYLQGNLNSYQAFVLFSYLIDIVSTKRSKAIKETIKVLIPSEFSELFLTTLGLSKYLHNLVHLSKAYHVLYEDYNEYQLQKESKYMTFKNSFNTYISMNKETLSEEMFAKKFQCFPAIIDYNLQSI